jgi:peroxiredoxin
MRKTIIPILSAVALIAAPAIASVKTGEAAPDFRLTDSKGTAHSLSDFKGKFVVLEWLSHDCPFVKKHYGAGNMQSLQKQAAADGVIWLSVCSSAEGKSGHMSAADWERKIAETGSVPAAVLIDADGAAGKQYGAKTTPHMFVIDPAGKLIYQGAIDSDSSPNPASITGAKNFVKQALDEARAGKPVSEPETKPYGCGVKY